MAPGIYEKEKELTQQITQQVERSLPDVEVLAVELLSPDRFCVYVDRPGGVDHALCERVTSILREYLREYSVDVSSPGLERPLRKQAHFRGAIGHRVTIRTPERKRMRGEVVAAGDEAVTIRTADEDVEVPYAAIVRGNLIEEG